MKSYPTKLRIKMNNNGLIAFVCSLTERKYFAFPKRIPIRKTLIFKGRNDGCPK
jgi:hypothetical protein